MSTIRDVAELAGVSIATVSNILNNKGTVGEETYQKVCSAMQVLNYKPNPMARNLKVNRLKFIGMIVPTLSGIYRDIIHGIQREMDKYDYYIILKTTNDIPSRETKAIDDFVTLGVQGIFTVTCFDSTERYQKAIAAGIPVLYIERTVDELNYGYVVFDNRSMTRNLYSNLLHKNVLVDDLLLLTGSKKLSSERDFIAGARQALENSGISPDVLRYFEISQNEVQSFGDILEIFDEFSSFPSHILLSSERMLDSLMDVLSIYDISPIEIYVPTGDRVSSSRYIPTIHPIPRRAIFCGRKSAEAMLSLIKNPMTYEENQIVIPTRAPDTKISTMSEFKKTRIRLLMTNNVMSQSICRILPAFQAETGVEVEYHTFDYQQDLYNEIMLRHQKNDDYYDIYMMDSPWMDYFESINCVRPLDDYLESDTPFTEHFVPEIWKNLNGNRNHVVGIPLVSMTQLMLYRKDLFSSPMVQRAYYRQNGIKLRPPKTWAEFNAVTRFFSKQFNPSSPTEYGVCLQGRKPNGLIQEFFPRQWSYKGRIVKGNKVVFNSVENLKAVMNLKEAYACSFPDIWNIMENEQVELFAKGNIAVINTYSGHIKSIIEPGYSTMDEMLGYGRIPGKFSLVGAWLLAINHFCDAPDEAFALIKWITLDHCAMQCSMIGGIAPNLLVAQNEQINDLYPWNDMVKELVKMERHRETITNYDGNIINNYQLEQIIADGLFDVLNNDLEPEKMLEICSNNLEAVIVKGG